MSFRYEHGLEKILIVDDDRAISLLLDNLFRREGYTIRTAADGKEALEIIRGTSNEPYEPGVAIVDLALPGIDGEELTRRIKESYPATQVVVLTGNEDTRSTVKLMRAGACDYITKPADNDELKHIVRLSMQIYNMEKRRLMLERRYEEAERNMGDGIPHFIRNPLVAIKTFSALVLERWDDPEFRTAFSRQVCSEVNRIDYVLDCLSKAYDPEQGGEIQSLFELTQATLVEAELRTKERYPVRRYGAPRLTVGDESNVGLAINGLLLDLEQTNAANPELFVRYDHDYAYVGVSFDQSGFEQIKKEIGMFTIGRDFIAHRALVQYDTNICEPYIADGKVRIEFRLAYKSENQNT